MSLTTPQSRDVNKDHESELRAVLGRDERAWRDFVTHYDPLLRDVVTHASEATERPLKDDEIDDVMGDFWASLVEDDLRVLRKFNPLRGAPILTWLTFHVAQLAHSRVLSFANQPEFVPIKSVVIADPRPLPAARLRSESRGLGTIDEVISDCVRRTMLSVLHEERATTNREREISEADRPRPVSWWAKQLNCSAESLIKRVKRGTLTATKLGCRFYFTKAQIEGSRRWERASQAGK